MTETTDYKNAPADIKATAERIASTWDFDRAVLSGAICAAILAERDAQRERDAKIADEVGQIVQEEGWNGAIEAAAAIRKG